MRITPASLAHLSTAGKYQPARHLALLNRELIRAATTPGDRLIITIPPQHGKSVLVSQHFPVWFLLRDPSKHVILASYGSEYAAEWGRKARQVMEQIGPSFGVRVSEDSSAANRWSTDKGGGMYAVGVDGPVTGRSADLLVIDDPTKGAEDACSSTMRARTWDWFQSVAYTRLQPAAPCVIIQTRWHKDDLAGRLLDSGGWRLVRLPALAEADDPLGRAIGEPLWPERFDAAILADRKKTLGSRWWSCLYQQNPVDAEGGMFRREWFGFADAPPAAFVSMCRFWDFAGTEARPGSDPDYTVGALVGIDAQGRYWILDIVRVRARAAEVEAIVQGTAIRDGKGVVIGIEQEPGSSGASVADRFVRDVLAGYAVYAERATGSKALRAQPFSAQAEAGNVTLIRAPWNAECLDEFSEFPFGAHDDQVDAAVAAATMALARGRPSEAWGSAPAEKGKAPEPFDRKAEIARMREVFGRGGSRLGRWGRR